MTFHCQTVAVSAEQYCVVLQSGLDAGVPGHGVSGWEPGVVDMGSGRCVPQGEERSQDCSEGLCQKTPWTD